MNDPITPGHRGELEFIRRLRTLLAPAPGRADPADALGPMPVPFGDDMVALPPGDRPLLWTVDMLMDGVDFDSAVHAWHAIGRKAMAVNLSDCAAMAVLPLAALCAVSLSNTLTMDNALDLVRGAHECGQRYGCPITGGDTNSWDHPTVVSLSVAARPPHDRQPVRRDGARPGDRIWLTGPVGGSILGRHLTFEPRIETALAISRDLRPHAMIDISDGLALDLWRILDSSGCGGVLHEPTLDHAVHPDAFRLSQQDHRPAVEHALYDGEDFELIVVLPPDAPAPACERLKLLPIGQVIDEPTLALETPAGQRRPLPVRGWEHFR